MNCAPPPAWQSVNRRCDHEEEGLESLTILKIAKQARQVNLPEGNKLHLP
jgi:hypothetical protein